MVFVRVVFYEFKALHFCSIFVQSSTQNDITSLELHRNAPKSRRLLQEHAQQPVCSQIVRMHYLELVFTMDLKGFLNCFPGLQPAQKSRSLCFKEPSTRSLSTLSHKLHVFCPQAAAGTGPAARLLQNGLDDV